ncbi:hypothetical protein [Novosphingobium hassiacum]|uniref:hypothetical protein n=1 Tax=Novosphingobium hassiacum TaxID=173676 RepID=UPI0031B6460E
MLNGRSHDVGLGTAGPVGISLADARDARDALRLKVKVGLDPFFGAPARSCSRNRVGQGSECSPDYVYDCCRSAYRKEWGKLVE